MGILRKGVSVVMIDGNEWDPRMWSHKAGKKDVEGRFVMVMKDCSYPLPLFSFLPPPLQLCSGRKGL